MGLARRSELVEEHAKKLSDKKGKLHAFKCDIRKEEDILKAFDWTTKNLGPVHILINNAGIGSGGKYLLEGKTEDWKAIFDVNVLGLCIATREAVKIMEENNINGHIVHINSIAGHKVINIPGINVYPGSKYAVTALTETLRQELNHLGVKIKVTVSFIYDIIQCVLVLDTLQSVSPGFVETEMTTFNKNNTPERLAILNSSPSLKAEDIADAIVYALSTPVHVQVN